MELSAQYREAEEAYKHGSMEAGQKMVDLREEAEALATAAYESSGWAQKQVDMEVEQINATRELTTAMASATDAWRENNAFSKGGAAGFLDSLFGGSDKEESDPKARAKNSLGLFAYGLDYVPYDEFPALLHQGERVLTASEARTMDRMLLLPGSGADKHPLTENRPAGAFAFGLRAAPYDGFPALLHQGERIQPPASPSGGNAPITIQIDQMSVRQESDIDAIAEALAQKLRNAMLRGGC